MQTKFLILFCCCYTWHICHGGRWKTEDAYIIDDDISDDDQPESTIDVPNVCKTSSGVQGQCVSIENCDRPTKFFLDVENQSTNFSTGIQRYINATDLEPCTPDSHNDAVVDSSSSNYVCCTSLIYTNVRNITLEEYSEKYSSKNPNETDVTIMQHIPKEEIEKVVDGAIAGMGEFPYAVAIIFNGGQICGGSLIDTKWVVSAAHCFDRFNSQAVRKLVIKVGDHDISNPYDVRHQDILVDKLLLHPGFFREKGFFRDDIALIKLKTPVAPSPNIQSIALHMGNPLLDGSSTTLLTVAGWGKTCSQCGQSSILRKTTVQVVTRSQCSQRYAGTQAPPITQNMICAGGTSGKDACNGDSGGPLVVHGGAALAGVVSWGIGCGTYPGVYTRVSSFVPWVRKHQNKL